MRKESQIKLSKVLLTVLCFTMLMVIIPDSASAYARIVILPFYSERGYDVADGDEQTLHYRRVMGYINNHLSKGGFEVINPFARDASEYEYNRLMERTRDDSVLASRDLCRKYAVDAAFIIWLEVKKTITEDGYCRAAARIDGQGYDSAGRDLGLSITKHMIKTKTMCDDAVTETEKDIGDLVGKALTAWDGNENGDIPADGKSVAYNSGGVAKKQIEENKQLITIRLEGATEYETSEIFGKIVSSATGVMHAKRYGSRIITGNPQACYQIWRITLKDIDPFVLQVNIMKMIQDIIKNDGAIVLKGIPYRYNACDIKLLKGVRPGDASSMEIQYVVDRESVRDADFYSRFDINKKRKTP